MRYSRRRRVISRLTNGHEAAHGAREGGKSREQGENVHEEKLNGMSPETHQPTGLTHPVSGPPDA